MIRKRVRLREALLPSDGRWMIASRDGLVDRSAENLDGSVSKVGAPFLLAAEASGTVGVAPSASARLGVGGRGPWAAALHTFLPTSVGLRCELLFAALCGLAVSLFDLLEALGGNAVGCAILLNALAKERLEKLA